MDKAIITLSWDDGHPDDLKVGELLDIYNLTGTFYPAINNERRKYMTSGQVKEISQIFDIGGHTYHHRDLTKISLSEAEKEIITGKQELESIIGREISSFCYPWGHFNDKIIKFVKNGGFKGARTTNLFRRNTKDPYKLGTIIPASNAGVYFLRVFYLMLYDNKFLGFILKNNLFFERWDIIALKTLDFIIDNGGVWHLWGHSWEIGSNDDWRKLEAIFKKIRDLGSEVQIVNNSELINLVTKENNSDFPNE